MFADKFVRREIENVKVNCTKVTAGCEWSGNLRFLEVRGISFASFLKYTLSGTEGKL